MPEHIWEHARNPFCLAGLNSGAAELQLLSVVFPASLPCNGQGLIGTMCEPGDSPNPQDLSGNNVLKLFGGWSRGRGKEGGGSLRSLPTDVRCAWQTLHTASSGSEQLRTLSIL